MRSGGDNVDVLYEKGTTQTLFDGDRKKQGLSEATIDSVWKMPRRNMRGRSPHCEMR